MPPANFNFQRDSSNRVRLPNLFCFSHLRWNFVYQRPQHLLSRATKFANVFFMEEPIFQEVREPEILDELEACGVRVLTPLFPHGYSEQESSATQRLLLDHFLEHEEIADFIAWYYTPMALSFTNHLHPQVTIYDCMDQLSAFQGAPPALGDREQELFERADAVFTGGRSLFEAKRGQHDNVHLFPSSIDYKHFAASRSPMPEPEDQQSIPHPRIGFFGVIDERLDRTLLKEIAAREPSYHYILIGPVVKIREDELPQAPNIHYLGQRQYSELPGYIAHWDAAMLPFALNESTRFISPTKTPEYLAAGKPVISTPLTDVIEPYGNLGLAQIAATPKEFCSAIARVLEPRDSGWLPAVDAFLGNTSWDQTFHDMWKEVLRHESREECQKREGVNV